MDVLTEEQYRILAFVALANEGGYAPSTQQIEAWLHQPTPPNAWNLDTVHSRIAHYLMGTTSPVKHLADIGWLDADLGHGHQVTRLGEALLRGAEQSQPDTVQVVVLGRDDPLAYPTLIGHLAQIGDALLVDPYLDAQGAMDLIGLTTVRRALIKEDSGKGRQAALSVLLSAKDAQGFEVRKAPDLHDRFVVSADDRVWTIGASLNGIGRRTTTVLTPIPSPTAEHVAQEVRQLWNDAAPLTVESAEHDEEHEDADTPSEVHD